MWVFLFLLVSLVKGVDRSEMMASCQVWWVAGRCKLNTNCCFVSYLAFCLWMHRFGFLSMFTVWDEVQSFCGVYNTGYGEKEK